MYIRFFVFVCLCAAVYGVIKNNNLVRLSSIVPFHIIYQVNLGLYWRNNSAHKYNYFETLFHTLAFHTNFSRIFHPCNWVPHFHLSHFPPLQSGAANSCLAFSTPATWRRIFMSRIFHPCKLVPQIHVSHFPPLHFWPSRIFMSRIFSRPYHTSEFPRTRPLFWPLSGRVFENRRFVPVFGPICKYIRTLPIAKAYDGMRQRIWSRRLAVAAC